MVMDGNAMNIDTQVTNTYWNLLKGLSSEIKLELIARLSSSLIKRNEEESSAHWTDSFAGKWQDERTVDEMMEDIRHSRSFTRRNIDL
jgi:hypothetical protein